MKKLDELKRMLFEEARSKNRILSELGISNGQFEYMKRQLRDMDLPVKYDRSNSVYYISGTDRLSDKEESLLRTIRKSGVNPRELRDILQGSKSVDLEYRPKRINWDDSTVKYGKFSDPHMGEKYYRPDVFRDFVARCVEEEVDFVINGGDTIEGMSRRQGQIYQLDYIGYSAQMDFFASEFELFTDAGLDVYSVESEDSHSGWYRAKGDMGVDIGKEMERRSKPYKFLGYNEQDLTLEDKLRIRVRHPGGGTAYAISYKMQKYIESLTGGDKPNIVDQGHYHKANYIFYRGVHCYDLGSMQDQSLYMKKKGTPSHVSFWITEVAFDESGIQGIKNQFYPYYD